LVAAIGRAKVSVSLREAFFCFLVAAMLRWVLEGQQNCKVSIQTNFSSLSIKRITTGTLSNPEKT